MWSILSIFAFFCIKFSARGYSEQPDLAECGPHLQHHFAQNQTQPMCLLKPGEHNAHSFLLEIWNQSSLLVE